MRMARCMTGNRSRRVLNAAFPGQGEYITQVWRMKQLEYSWLRSLMRRYEDFRTVTRDSLIYTLGTIGLTPDPIGGGPACRRLRHAVALSGSRGGA